MTRGLSAVLAIALLVSACGPIGGSSPGPSATKTVSPPTATASSETFGVLEVRHCQASEPAACETVLYPAHDTVALAGRDGFARAKTTFTPRKIPDVGNANPVLDLEAQVANGAVYFIDGSGVIRRLDASGAVSRVATFAIDSGHQSVSFVVSPDGQQLMAAVLTYPKHQTSSDPSQPFGTFTGPWRLQIERANAGGATVIVHQWQSDTTLYPGQKGGFDNVWLVGWDAKGPIILLGQATGTQNAWLANQRYFGGMMARLKADGTSGPPIGPSGCLPYWRPTHGLIACTILGNGNAPPVVDVVELSGKVIWSGHAPAGQDVGGLAPSPDGSMLAMNGEVVTLRDNSTVGLAADFQPQGWLDDATLIGWLPVPHAAPHVAILHLSDPKHPEDWGFTGAFVGTVPQR